jgi:hypothetical protein
MNIWMNECHMNFMSSYKSMCQMCFQCIILVCETYELWMNKFCMIFITNSWDAKFMMTCLYNGQSKFEGLQHLDRFEKNA